MQSTTPAQYALILLSLAEERGIPTDAVIAGSSLAMDGLTSIGARVSDVDFRVLSENAQRLTGEPALGLYLGQRLNFSAHAILGQTFMTCSDLGEVIQVFERYYHVLAPELSLSFDTQDEEFVIASHNTAADLPREFGLELISAAMRNTIEGMLGLGAIPIRFEFPYPAPAYVAIYRKTLGDDIHFDCPMARWSLPTSLLATPVPSSNPALRKLYEAECARLLADLEDGADLSARTRRLLRKFEGQYPKMPQVAAMLNMSARTYRRRLAEEKSSFQELLDEVRAEHATRYLQEGRLPIASIAYQLGFSDPSNFRRAYRHWTGQTPSDVRPRSGSRNDP